MKKIHLLLIVLFACFLFFTGCKKDEYVVTFNPNGGKGTIVTQNFTEKIAQALMVNSFTNRGYTFTGWNTKPDGAGTAYQDLEIIKVSGSMVLYAQWDSGSGEFKITFDANGGTEEMEPQIFKAGELQELFANKFLYDGYKFTGWCTSANGNGKKFDNQQPITVISDMTLYAQWTRELYDYYVHFYANGGTGTMEPQAFIEGVYQELDSNVFKRENYDFKEWNTKEDGKGESYFDNEKIKLFTNMKLYAQWDTIGGRKSRIKD